jgi:hypothetical protein
VHAVYLCLTHHVEVGVAIFGERVRRAWRFPDGVGRLFGLVQLFEPDVPAVDGRDRPAPLQQVHEHLALVGALPLEGHLAVLTHVLAHVRVLERAQVVDHVLLVVRLVRAAWSD